MANLPFNVSLGMVNAYHNRVENDDPANSAIILIPIETADLPSDATLRDLDTLADILAAANEQTTMGRKTLTQADIAPVTIDDANDRAEAALPAVTWTGASGNPIAKMLVCYDPDTTSGDDSNIVPLTMFDCVLSPDGNDFILSAGSYFRASA